MTSEEYMAFSKLSYISFSSGDKGMRLNSLKQTTDNPYGPIKAADLASPELSIFASISNWKLIAFQPNTASGFSGAAFQAPDVPNGEPGEIVFAFRGTEPKTTEDISTDFDIFMQDNYGHLANQFSSAESFVSTTLNNPSYSGSTYSFTGHSMGGGLAQWIRKTKETTIILSGSHSSYCYS